MARVVAVCRGVVVRVEKASRSIAKCGGSSVEETLQRYRQRYGLATSCFNDSVFLSSWMEALGDSCW
jgi:hypothetical protein